MEPTQTLKNTLWTHVKLIIKVNEWLTFVKTFNWEAIPASTSWDFKIDYEYGQVRHSCMVQPYWNYDKVLLYYCKILTYVVSKLSIWCHWSISWILEEGKAGKCKIFLRSLIHKITSSGSFLSRKICWCERWWLWMHCLGYNYLLLTESWVYVSSETGMNHGWRTTASRGRASDSYCIIPLWQIPWI